MATGPILRTKADVIARISGLELFQWNHTGSARVDELVTVQFAINQVTAAPKVGPMPWTLNDAEKHTHKAVTTELRELWAKVANERLEKTGDEGRAIREANSVVARRAGSGT